MASLRHVLLIVTLLFCVTGLGRSVHGQPVGADKCDFGYLPGMFLAEPGFKDVTADILADNKRKARISQLLPGFKFVLNDIDNHYWVLIGWSENPFDFTTLSRQQAAGQLRMIGEYATRQFRQGGGDIDFSVSDDDPISARYVTEYENQSVRYRDLGLGVIASPWCILSVRISAPTLAEDTPWPTFHARLDDIRARVAAREGQVRYSLAGQAREKSKLQSIGNALALSIFLAAVCYFMLHFYFRVRPSRVTSYYSWFISVLAGFQIAMILLASEADASLPTLPPPESILVFAIVLAVHLYALIFKSAIGVGAALSVMAGLFGTSLVYAAAGWYRPTGGEWIGLVIGVGLLVIVFLRGFRRRSTAD